MHLISIFVNDVFTTFHRVQQVIGIFYLFAVLDRLQELGHKICDWRVDSSIAESKTCDETKHATMGSSRQGGVG